MALVNRIKFYFEYWVKYQANIAYLRSQGVRIGEGCDVITSVKNFGSEPWLIEIGNDVTLTAGVLLIYT